MSRYYKGQIQEQLEMFVILLVLIISVSMLFFIAQKNRIGTERMLIFLKWSDFISSDVIGIYIYYVPGIDRTLLIALADLYLFGDSAGDVYYGWKYGNVDVRNILESYFDNTLGDDYMLVFDNLKLGNVNDDCRNVITFDFLLPIPSYSGEVKHAKLYKCI